MSQGIASFSESSRDVVLSEIIPLDKIPSRSNEEAIYLAVVNQDWSHASSLLEMCNGKISEGKIKKLLYFTYFNDMKKISHRNKWILDHSLLEMVKILDSDYRIANTLKSKRGVPAYVTLLNNILKTNGHSLSEFSPKSQAMISKDSLKRILLNKVVRETLESVRSDPKKVFDYIRRKHEKWVRDFFCKADYSNDSCSLLQGESLIASVGQSIKSRKPINVLEAQVALVDLLKMFDDLEADTRLNSISSNSLTLQNTHKPSEATDIQPLSETDRENLLEEISTPSENQTVKVNTVEIETPFPIPQDLLEFHLEYSQNLKLICAKIPSENDENKKLSTNQSLIRTVEQLKRCLCFVD
mgnify:CR=1 FL=1